MLSSKPLCFGSEIMLATSFLSSSRHVLRAGPRFCFFRGSQVKASYSNSPGNGTVEAAQQHLLDSCPYRVNGTNGSGKSLFLNKNRILDALDDGYEGVVINPDKLPTDTIEFASRLRFSLYEWKVGSLFANNIQGKKGIWLKLPLERSDLVPVASREGFEYHHAERSYVMMTYWVPQGPSLLPPNASHHVGVGSFVINHKDEVLVVQEKHCPPELVGLWKIPTSFILESEEIYNGAVREVKEETGIDTEFVEVVAFRHAQNVSFDKSDLFFVCMLRPLSTKIMVDDVEIQAAKWMPLTEFANQPLIIGDDLFGKIIEICIAQLGKHYCGLSVNQLVSKFDGKLSSLYFNIVDYEYSDCQAK